MSDTTIADKVESVLTRLGDALAKGDAEAASSLFQTDCYWRDLVLFTWNIRTMEGRDQIRDMLEAQLDTINPSNWRIQEGEEATEDGDVITAWITLETELARGKGLIRIRGGEIWTLLTTIKELKGYEEPVGPTRPGGVEHSAIKGRLTWKENRSREKSDLGYKVQPRVVIVGGGQGGIGLGARLRMMGVPAIILERNEHPGDSWRNRYKSLCLHDPVWYDHMPYLPFPPNWPVFSPKDKLGDWLEMYTRVMELNYWTRSTCVSSSFDEGSKTWRVEVDRDGERVVLKPEHLILATGMSGKPNVPQFKGMETFRGQQHHSSAHSGPEGHAGKKAIIIGSNNSAHDIAAALWEGGAEVTMVQRSSTHIVRSETLMDIGLGALYSEEAVRGGMTTEKADLIFASLPYRIMHEFQKPLYDQMRERDADFYDRLKRAGFLLDWGEDGSGLFMKYLRRGSGYYIDVGASDLIADGKIALESGREVREITPEGVVLEDGKQLRADLIVYATGYGSMNGWAADLIGQDVADKVGKCWGLGSDTAKDPGPWEGEQRNMWKPTQQENLWFHGGNLHQSRHYSQFLALQLKARLEGLPTPVYGLQESHHLS